MTLIVQELGKPIKMAEISKDDPMFSDTEIYGAFVDDDTVEAMSLSGVDGTLVNITKQRLPEEPTNLIVFRKKITLE